MYKTTFTHFHSLEMDRVEEVIHDFGNGIRVVSNLVECTTRKFHGEIQVEEFELIQHTEYYLNYLNSIDNEVNKTQLKN